MKTLKKTLCLVLAMVMVFGLCVTSASAKLDAYEDKDDINYAEAVDVMTGIGVLAGDARGFRPGDDITRAEAAKIIAYIMIGDAARADALKATSDPFPDVPASHWAAGYISYCATAGIIAGMGDGYHPNDNVTGLQFAKMLLAALGYGVNDEYVGTDWAINVSRDALRLRIFEKNIAGANNNKATREECALYAFNAVTKVDKVSYSALLGGYITTAGSGLGNATGTDAPDANMAENFARDFKLVKEYNEEDDFGRDTGHHWILTTAKRPIITAEYDADEYLKPNANDDNIRATFTTGVTGADIYNALGSDVSKSTTTVELYVNGIHDGGGYDRSVYTTEWFWKNPSDEEHNIEENRGNTTYGYYDEVSRNLVTDVSGKGTSIARDNFKKSNDKVLEGTGNGVQTYVYGMYIDGTLRIKICLIDTYLAQVTRVVAATDNKDPETTVKLVQKDSKVNGEYVTEIPANLYTYATDEFKKDDYVLVTIADKDGTDLYRGDPSNLAKDEDGDVAGEIQTMIPAITKVTEVSKYSKRGNDVSVVIDDTTHVAAKNSAGDYKTTDVEYKPPVEQGIDDAATMTNVIVDGKDHTIYYDEFGYLIATSPVKDLTNYVYVAQFGIKMDPSNNLTDKFVLKAHVYYADGTDDTVTVDTKAGIFNERELNTESLEAIAKEYGYSFDRAVYDYVGNDDPDDDTAFEIGLYSMTTDKGKVTLNKDVSTDEYTRYICMADNDADDEDGAPPPHDEHVPDLTAEWSDNEQYVSKGQARIDNDQPTNRADGKTVFFYVNGNYNDKNFSVTVYTGINAVPTTKYDDRTDAALSEYAVTKKASTTGTHAVQAAVIDATVKGESSTIVYFFGGTEDEANFDKLKNDWTVSYKVYGGDKLDRVEIKYKDTDSADKAIKNLQKPGFVKVNGDGDLEYIAGSYNVADDKNGNSPFNYVKEEGKVYYVNASAVIELAGIRNHTVTATVAKTATSGSTPDSPAMNDLLMPLYDIESVVDLRTRDEKRDAGNMTITDVDGLLTLFGLIEDNHDMALNEAGTKYVDYEANNVTSSVKIDGLVVAISFTGHDDGDKTDVIKTVYILDNIDCTNRTQHLINPLTGESAGPAGEVTVPGA